MPGGRRLDRRYFFASSANTSWANRNGWKSQERILLTNPSWSNVRGDSDGQSVRPRLFPAIGASVGGLLCPPVATLQRVSAKEPTQSVQLRTCLRMGNRFSGVVPRRPVASTRHAAARVASDSASGRFRSRLAKT